MDKRIFEVKVKSEEFRDAIIQSLTLCRFHFIEPCDFVVGDKFVTIDDNCNINIYDAISACGDVISLNVDSLLIVGMVDSVNSFYKAPDYFIKM